MTFGHNTLPVRGSHGTVVFGGLCTRWDLAGGANCCLLGAKWSLLIAVYCMLLIAENADG